MFEKIVLSLSVLLLVAFMTSGCIEDFITPAFIDTVAMDYAKVDPNEDIINPLYTSLFDAKRVHRKINHIHVLNQKELSDALTDDILVYSYVNDLVAIGMADATELRDNIFSPTSPIGMLFPGLAGMAIGWLGLSKPSEKRKIMELEKNVTTYS